MKKIFISYSTPINRQQQDFFNKIKDILLKFKCEYTIVDNIKVENPYYKIQDEINKSDAIICLAFIKKQYGIFKRRYYTSLWIDVELSLALQNNLKYYIFCDAKVEDTCILNRKFKSPKINYINNWKEVDILHFIQWLKTI